MRTLSSATRVAGRRHKCHSIHRIRWDGLNPSLLRSTDQEERREQLRRMTLATPCSTRGPSTLVQRQRPRTTSMRCSLRPRAAPPTRPQAGSAPHPSPRTTSTFRLAARPVVGPAERDPDPGRCRTRPHRNDSANAMAHGPRTPTVTQGIQSDPKGCEALSSMPTNFASATPDVAVSPYSPSSQPLMAAHAIQGVVSGGTLGFAFSAMDARRQTSSDLLPASLQNASGALRPPSSASITAALSDATAAPNGTLIPNRSPRLIPLPTRCPWSPMR